MLYIGKCKNDDVWLAMAPWEFIDGGDEGAAAGHVTGIHDYQKDITECPLCFLHTFWSQYLTEGSHVTTHMEHHWMKEMPTLESTQI